MEKMTKEMLIQEATEAEQEFERMIIEEAREADEGLKKVSSTIKDAK